MAEKNSSPKMLEEISKDFDLPPRLKRTVKAFALTKREREVVTASLTDLPRKAIADSLEISESTLDFHFKNIFKKIGVHSRVGMLGRFTCKSS